MANPHRGEVELKAGDRRFTFVLRTKECQELEAHFTKKMGRPPDRPVKFGELAWIIENNLGMNDVVDVLRVGLHRNHGELKDDELADLADEISHSVILQAIGDAIKSAFPDLVAAGEKAQAQGKARLPPTGASSALPH